MVVKIYIVLVLCCSVSWAEESANTPAKPVNSGAVEESITIPLTEIWSTNQERMWAVDVPVTKHFGQVLKGDPASELLLAEIRKALGSGPKDKADPAFVVEGEGREALRNAHSVLAGKQHRSSSLSGDKSVSVVFFALESMYYITITDVIIQGDTIFIKYEYIPHSTENINSSFSLIPLGKLSPRHYRVEIDHEPFEKRFAKFHKSGPHEHALGRVSTSFGFEIKQ